MCIRDSFYNDRWQVLEERLARNLTAAQKETTVGSPHVQYVWDIRYLDSPICRFRDANDDWDADGDGEKDPGSDGLEETLYYLTDANQNVTAVVDPAGNVVERYLYDAYGRVHVLNGAADPDGTVLAEWTLDPDNVSDWSNEILYAGYRHDPETLLYHVRHRYLHATLGRWLTSDPKGYVDGMSLYEYCRSGPIGAVDAMGQQTDPDLRRRQWMIDGNPDEIRFRLGVDPHTARRMTEPAYWRERDRANEAEAHQAAIELYRSQNLAKLLDLCKPKFLGSSDDKVIAEARAEAKLIYDTYAKAVRQARNMSLSKRPTLFAVFFPNTANNRCGLMCYQWQQIVFRELNLLDYQHRLKHFRIDRVGYVTQRARWHGLSSTLNLVHSWVAVSVGKVKGGPFTKHSFQATAFLDPWLGGGKARVFTPQEHFAEGYMPNFLVGSVTVAPSFLLGDKNGIVEGFLLTPGGRGFRRTADGDCARFSANWHILVGGIWRPDSAGN